MQLDMLRDPLDFAVAEFLGSGINIAHNELNFGSMKLCPQIEKSHTLKISTRFLNSPSPWVQGDLNLQGHEFPISIPLWTITDKSLLREIIEKDEIYIQL